MGFLLLDCSLLSADCIGRHRPRFGGWTPPRSAL